MASRYRLTFTFFDTQEQAAAFCESENKNPYIRKYHKAHFTPWQSKDGTENKFIAWYAVK